MEVAFKYLVSVVDILDNASGLTQSNRGPINQKRKMFVRHSSNTAPEIIHTHGSKRTEKEKINN